MSCTCRAGQREGVLCVRLDIGLGIIKEEGVGRLTSTLMPSLSFDGVLAPSSAVVLVIWEMLDLRGGMVLAVVSSMAE